jgi:hypothetical protein
MKIVFGSLNWKGFFRSSKPLHPMSQMSVNGPEPSLCSHSFGGSLIFALAPLVDSSKPTFFPSISTDHDSLSNGAQSSLFHFTQFFSLSSIALTVSANARPLGVVCRSSSITLLTVSCTHCASAVSSVKSICNERLRGDDQLPLAAFVKVKRWLSSINNWNRNCRRKWVSAIWMYVSVTTSQSTE